jgi:hypothetical protein
MKHALPITFFVALSALMAISDDGVSAAPTARNETPVVAYFVNGKASVAMKGRGGLVKATLGTSKAASTPFRDGFRWGGEGTQAPVSLMTLIVVQVGPDKLYVPLSAYSDLGDPRRVSLNPAPLGFELLVSGGDAGAGYTAVLVFEKGWLTRRRVTHGEFPKQVWEETRYAYNKLDN